MKYTVKVLENDYITFDQLQNSEIVNVYIPFVNINNFLIDTYGAFEFKHSSTILIEKLLSEFKNLDEDFCFINVSNNYFEIVILKNKKVTLFNCFGFKTKEGDYIINPNSKTALESDTHLIVLGNKEQILKLRELF